MSVEIPRNTSTPTNTDKTEQIRNQEMVTVSIIAKRLSRYEKAAEISGYIVSEIAQPGQTFVTYNGYELIKSASALDSKKIPKKNITTISPPVFVGHLGISIEKPEKEQNYGAFWIAFDSLEPESTKSEK